MCLEIKGLRDRVREWEETLAGLHAKLETTNADLRESCTEVETLRREVKVQMAKAKWFWAQKCKQLLAQEAAIEEDTEIARLQEQIRSRTQGTTAVDTWSEDSTSLPETEKLPQGCRGKAPPVDPFKGSDPEVRFDD